MASDSSAFKSLTEFYDTIKNSTFGQHFVTVDKPSSTENHESEKEIALSLGFKGFIGMNSTVAEAFTVYTEGVGVFTTLSALAMKSTTSAVCTASTKLNAAFEWGKTDTGLRGVAVKTTLSGDSKTGTSTEAALMHSAVILTFQQASDVATMLPGIDIAG